MFDNVSTQNVLSKNVFSENIFKIITYQMFSKIYYKWFFNITSNFSNFLKCYLNFAKHPYFSKTLFRLKAL